SAVWMLAFVFGAQPNQPTQFAGTVVHVHDGDTVHIQKADGTTVKVRFLLCDAPEIGQPRGVDSREFVKSLCLNKTATVVSPGLDEHGRTLGELFVGTTSVNKEVIRNGWGWWFYHYNDDPAIGLLEVEARAGKKGLFADEAPLYPRAWRRGARFPAGSGASDAAGRSIGADADGVVTPVDSSVFILALFPDPAGRDEGQETITLGNSATSEVGLEGWSLVDNNNDRLRLTGTIAGGGSRTLKLDQSFLLGNGGDRILLNNRQGTTVHSLSYDKAERGKFIVAGPK
ncbi:MAG: thermonuclease family protein, partial [Planctomycetaceae bacterium]